MQLVFFPVGAVAGGAITTYLFNRPILNQVGLKILGLGGLYGAAIQAASFGLCYFAIRSAQKRAEKTNKEKLDIGYVLSLFGGTHVLSGVVLSVAAKLFLNRIGIPMSYKEAFTHYALSSIAALSILFVFDAR